MISKLLIYATGLALASASVAQASETDEDRSQAIRIHGDVEQRCQISSPKSVDLGDLQRPNPQASLNFGFVCNTPFVLEIKSDKGALTNLQSPQGDGPYSGQLPYSVALSLPIRKPSSSLVTGTFSSAALRGGRQVSSQGGIATEGFGLVLVAGKPDSDAGLLAGDYVDTITLTVSVI